MENYKLTNIKKLIDTEDDSDYVVRHMKILQFKPELGIFHMRDDKYCCDIFIVNFNGKDTDLKKKIFGEYGKEITTNNYCTAVIYMFVGDCSDSIINNLWTVYHFKKHIKKIEEHVKTH